MAVFRVERNTGYTVMSNHHLRNKELRAMGFDPYVMIYERPTAPPVTRHLQRWVNNKRLFYAVPRFEDYIPGRKEV